MLHILNLRSRKNAITLVVFSKKISNLPLFSLESRDMEWENLENQLDLCNYFYINAVVSAMNCCELLRVAD